MWGSSKTVSSRPVADDDQPIFSPALYHVDTGPQVLYRYDILGDDGTLSERREMLRWPGCSPDGLAIAASGHVLVAVAPRGQHGFIAVVAPDGTEEDRWAVDAEHVTSLCIGGRDGRTVFATMGGSASPDERSGVLMRLDQQIEDCLARERV